MKRKLPARAGAIGFLVLLWCVCLYRAATQSFVHDEALTWELYLNQPFSTMFHLFSTNNHFLNTLLMRLSLRIFGLSELALRLPALAGAALFFAAIYRFTRAAYGPGYTALLAIAALALNPLTLDFMVAARGYGLALALLLWALAEMLHILASPAAPRKIAFAIAGAALALSVTANLTFLVPAFMLGMVFVTLQLRRGRNGGPRPAWLAFLLPAGAIAVAFAILFPFNPLDANQRADFYYGAASLAESARSLASAALQHGGPPPSGSALNPLRDLVAFGIAPVVFAAGLWVGVRRRDDVLILSSWCAVGSMALIAVLHAAIGLLYPLDRTGIYFGALLAIVLVRLAYVMRGWLPWASRIGYAIACLGVLVFLSEFDVHRFSIWDYDAATNRLAGEIAARRNPAASSVQVGGDWMFEPALNFYRVKNRWTWMAPVLRRTLDAPADFYALMPDRDPAKLGITPVWTSPLAHSILAVRKP